MRSSVCRRARQDPTSNVPTFGVGPGRLLFVVAVGGTAIGQWVTHQTCFNLDGGGPVSAGLLAAAVGLGLVAAAHLCRVRTEPGVLRDDDRRMAVYHRALVAVLLMSAFAVVAAGGIQPTSGLREPIDVPTRSWVWTWQDQLIARRVEEVTGRSFHRRVRIVERHLSLPDDPSQRAAAERAWGVGMRPDGPDRAAQNMPPFSYEVLGRYLPGEDLVLLAPRGAGPLRRAVVAHELAHALADQHGGVRGGNALATEAFAGLVEGRVVPDAGPWRNVDRRIPADASYTDLGRFWLPYVAAPLAFEVIEQAWGAKGVWSAFRERSGRAVLTPDRWIDHQPQDPPPPAPASGLRDPSTSAPIEGPIEVVSVRLPDPGHWLILLGQYHDAHTCAHTAASVVETVEISYLDPQERACVTASVASEDRPSSARLRQSLAPWVREHDSRTVTVIDAVTLQVSGCDPGPGSAAAWLAPQAAQAVQQHIDQLADVARTGTVPGRQHDARASHFSGTAHHRPDRNAQLVRQPRPGGTDRPPDTRAKASRWVRTTVRATVPASRPAPTPRPSGTAANRPAVPPSG